MWSFKAQNWNNICILLASVTQHIGRQHPWFPLFMPFCGGPYSGKPNASNFTQGIVSQQPIFLMAKLLENPKLRLKHWEVKLFLGIALAKSSLKNRKVTRLQYWILVSTWPEISNDDSIILFIYFCFIHDLHLDKWLKIPRQDYKFFSNLHVHNCH